MLMYLIFQHTVHGKNGCLSISINEIWGEKHADKFSTKSGLIRSQKGIKPGKVSILSVTKI